MSDTPGGPGWWQASDLKWYPPAPSVLPPPPRQPKGPSRFTRWFTSLSGRRQFAFIAAVLIAGGAVLGTIGYLNRTVHTPAEKVYLSQMGDLAKGDNANALGLGHTICKWFAEGMSQRSVAAEFAKQSTTDVAAFQYAIILNAATSPGSLCPQYAYKLDQK